LNYLISLFKRKQLTVIWINQPYFKLF